MAKSKGFFAMRRGSAGDLTFSVLNGQQITKQKVSQVTNPKSTGQVVQRMKLAPAQKFYTAFEALLNHSFQNIEYGNKSRQFFMSEAMKQNGGPYIAKGVDILSPGTYLISKGSQGTVNVNYEREFYDTDGYAGYITNIKLTKEYGTTAGNVRSHDEFVADVLENNPWIHEGQKITVMAVVQSRESYGQVIYTPFFFQILLKADGLTVPTSLDEDPQFSDGFEYLYGQNIKRDGFFNIPADDFPTGWPAALGVIVSSGTKKSDLRTTSRMAVDPDTYRDFYSETAYKYAIASYQDSASVQVGDEWLLNTLASGLYGRVVTKSARVSSYGHNYDINYLALVYEIAGVQETRVFVNNDSQRYVINTNGQVVSVPYNTSTRPVSLDDLGDTTDTIVWNDAYLSLLNGGSPTASAPAVSPIRPLPEILAVPAKITASDPSITKMVIEPESGMLLPYGLSGGTPFLYRLQSEEVAGDLAARVVMNEGNITEIVYDINFENAQTILDGIIAEQNVTFDSGALMISSSLTPDDFINVRAPYIVTDLNELAGVSAESKFGKVGANANIQVLGFKENTNFTAAIVSRTGEGNDLQVGDKLLGIVNSQVEEIELTEDILNGLASSVGRENTMSRTPNNMELAQLRWTEPAMIKALTFA